MPPRFFNPLRHHRALCLLRNTTFTSVLLGLHLSTLSEALFWLHFFKRFKAKLFPVMATYFFAMIGKVLPEFSMFYFCAVF